MRCCAAGAGRVGGAALRRARYARRQLLPVEHGEPAHAAERGEHKCALSQGAARPAARQCLCMHACLGRQAALPDGITGSGRPPWSCTCTGALTAARVCVGVAQGFIIPSIHTVLSQARGCRLTPAGRAAVGCMLVLATCCLLLNWLPRQPIGYPFASFWLEDGCCYDG